MSLINQMLRDLDAREAEQPTLRAVETPAPVRNSTEKNGSALRTPFLLLLVLAVLVSGWMLYPDLVPGPSQMVASGDAEPTGPSVPKEAVSIPEEVTTVVTTVKSTEADEEKTSHVEALPVVSEEPTQSDDDQNNGAGVVTEQHNGPTVSGAIDQLVIQTIDQDPSSGDPASLLRQQGGSVATIKPIELQPVSNNIPESEQVAADLSQQAELLDSGVADSVLDVRPRPKPVKEPSSTGVVSIGPAPASKVIQVKSKRVPRDPTAQLYQSARSAYASGQVIKAASQLVAVLEASPEHLEARELLILLHMNAGDLDRATHVVEQGLLFNPGEPTLISNKARIAIERGETNRARRILVAGLTDHADNLELLTMLGVLLQQSGDFDEAIRAYQRLVMLETNESRHWAGLAISYDAGNNGIRALEAYLQALKLGDLPSNVAIYAERRVQELRPANQAQGASN